MIKYYCDRCGKEIEDAQRGVLHHRVHYGEVFLQSIRLTEGRLATYRTLCYDCETSFISWYKHPEADDDKK